MSEKQRIFLSSAIFFLLKTALALIKLTKKRNLVIMPRIFTSDERDRIENKLMESAGECLALYGVRRTTVDEIVRRSHIAKGSFYLFYDSKEDLFLSLLESFISSIEPMYLGMLEELDENHIATSLTEIFYSIALRFEEEGIYRFLDGENAALIERKVEKQRLVRLEDELEKSLVLLFSYFSIDDKDDISRFMRSYKAVLSLYLIDNDIKERESTVKTLIRGLVLQLLE